MQVATERNGQPWLSTLNYVFDNDLNLYWLSLRSRRHSKELMANKKVSAAILHDPEVKRCLHIEGEAREVTGKEITPVHKLYCEKYGDKPERLADAQSGDPDRRAYYVIKPKIFVLFDEINFPNQPRQEFKIK